MSKKKNNKTKNKNTQRNTRQTYKTARDPLRFPTPSSTTYRPQADILLDFTDLPTKPKKSKTNPRTRSEPVQKQQTQENKNLALQHGLNKTTLSKEQICKRRSERKEIIHAVKKSGQSGQKPPDQTHRGIKC